MIDLFDFCIVGSGPSGLTCSYELLKENKKVLMIERDDRSGGLAKSYNYDGNIFDTGPKRFHTDDEVVKNFLNEIAQMETIGRSTKVYFANKYFDWPLNLKSIFRMPLSTTIKSLYDLINKEDIQDIESFEQYINFKYGNHLYKTFFKPYTEKFLRIPAENIHSDWAMTGINRTVIDKKVKADSILDIIKSLALPQKVDTKFLYPSTGGFGEFFNKLYNLNVNNKNFFVKFNTIFNQLKYENDIFSAQCINGKNYKFKNLIWTGNLNDLVHLIDDTSKTDLNYINTVFYNFICRENNVKKNKAQWIYISDGKKLISRITCMKEFVKSTTPDGYYNFITEVTDSQNQPLYFNDPGKFKDIVIKELMDISFLKKNKIDDIKINAVKDTYPIYHKKYKSAFGNIVRKVKQFSQNITLLGRSGAYWYNNSDHSIRMAIEISKKLLKKKSEKEFDYRKYF